MKLYRNEIFSKGPKRNYITRKTDVYLTVDIWNVDLLDLKDYGPENTTGYRYVLVLIDQFSKLGWSIPLKNKNAQTTKDSSEVILITSKNKPNLIKTDRGKEPFKNKFKKFPK